MKLNMPWMWLKQRGRKSELSEERNINMGEVRLKSGREKSLLRGHPWIFSGSVANTDPPQEQIESGETVRVIDHSGAFLAWGAFSPISNIRVRVWSRNPDETISADFFHARLEGSISRRASLLGGGDTNAFRLVHAESDGIPGLVVDKYADTLVLQFLASGVEFWREILVELLLKITDCTRIYERSDAKVRELEGLPARSGILHGSDDFEQIRITENGLVYWVDVRRGQKTGFYLDQRNNRAIVQQLAANRTVLDCFAYNGGFSIPALAGQAEYVVAIESSKEALKLGRKNTQSNTLPADNVDWVEGDVFQELRRYRDKGEQFEMIILDPPKFAPTAAHAQRAARGYKDINLLGLKLLKPGGLLLTFSCSGGISEDFFQKIISGAAKDANVDGKIIARLGAGPDHPVALSFPEGAYLKGFVIQI
jgi:23S rRNA (cytosine1962-C5)-methyltransferase